MAVSLGDARLSLERAAPQAFDLLALDAFNSDAIPVHLLTEEAFTIYGRHLQTQGILAVPVSNKSVNPEPVIANLVRRCHYWLATVENPPFPDKPWLFGAILDLPVVRAAARPPRAAPGRTHTGLINMLTAHPPRHTRAARSCQTSPRGEGRAHLVRSTDGNSLAPRGTSGERGGERSGERGQPSPQSASPPSPSPPAPLEGRESIVGIGGTGKMRPDKRKRPDAARRSRRQRMNLEIRKSGKDERRALEEGTQEKDQRRTEDAAQGSRHPLPLNPPSPGQRPPSPPL